MTQPEQTGRGSGPAEAQKQFLLPVLLLHACIDGSCVLVSFVCLRVQARACARACARISSPVVQSAVDPSFGLALSPSPPRPGPSSYSYAGHDPDLAAVPCQSACVLIRSFSLSLTLAFLQGCRPLLPVLLLLLLLHPALLTQHLRNYTPHQAVLCLHLGILCCLGEENSLVTA